MLPHYVPGSQPPRTTGRRLIRNSEAAKADILRAATQEFLEKGYSGGRMHDIAERSGLSKRMLYYHYGHKRDLYVAVLANYLSEMRSAELNILVDESDPVEALVEITSLTFEFHLSWAEETRLMMVENMQRGKNIEAIEGVGEDSRSLMETIQRLLDRGVERGVVRSGLTALDVYTTISSLAFFNVSSRYTFSRIFNHDMTSAVAVCARRAQVMDLVRRYISV